MRRRDFVTLFGSTALAWPFAGHTQQLNNHRIGYLGVASAASQDTRFGAFRAGLATLGYVEGKNIVIEQRWLGNRPYDQLDNLARQLVDWRHAAIFVDKILKGTRPANIPVEQPTKFQTIVNLRTAKTIGVEVATSLLLRADDVIE
jgi:hypothetical protein